MNFIFKNKKLCAVELEILDNLEGVDFLSFI